MASKTTEKPRHLGRGLQSLIGPIISEVDRITSSVDTSDITGHNYPSDKDLESYYKEIPIDSISKNPFQMRTRWDEQDLKDLAESIRVNGIIQPVIVRKTEQGYQLIAG